MAPLREIYFADLTHTAQGISAPTFPLGVSYVAAYVKEQLNDQVSVKLFKFPKELDSAIAESPPSALFLSNYSWNFRLAYKIASVTKRLWPNTIIVCGGPNFPTAPAEQKRHLDCYRDIDFFIQLEGELGSVHLIRELLRHDFNAELLKSAQVTLLNCVYLWQGELVCGPTERIFDVNVVPSPYLTGLLDPFFDLPLIPMLETTRGCPFSCTFCADGLKTKNRVVRFAESRTQAELEYISARIHDVDELIITDLNFAMYREDASTAQAISSIQAQTGWPRTISASAGKNKPSRVIEVADILQGSWTMGASIQSTDVHVLESIKRKNISSEAYAEVIEYGNTFKDGKTHSEIILGLPGDSKEKHFESLRFGVDNRVSAMRMFQAMLLMGTEMAEPASRKRFGLVTRFRVVPGCIGNYEILGRTYPVAEIEEIIVGGKDLSFDDYLDCRVMNLIVESFYNNSVFEELFSVVRKTGGSVFDVLLNVFEHVEDRGAPMNAIIGDFVRHTQIDLYETYAEAEEVVLSDEMIGQYVGGELGINELLVHRALLFGDFPDMCRLIFASARNVLRDSGLLTSAADIFLKELERFTVLRKGGILAGTDQRPSGHFAIDLSGLDEIGFNVNPNDVNMNSATVNYEFFHTDEQKEHIRKQTLVYSSTPIGLGRLMQRSNLKLFYRHFSQTPG